MLPVSPESAVTFFIAAFVLAVAPGPDNIFVLTQSAVYGRRAGYMTTLGLTTGLLFHTTIVALGFAALLQSHPYAFTVLKIIGACYLVYLAWLSFTSAAVTAVLKGKDSFPGYGALYRRGVLMNITNPKVTLFFLAFLPQFVNYNNGQMVLQIAIFGALFMVATLVVFNIVAFMGGYLAGIFNKSTKGQVFINRLAGCVFLAMAAMLVIKQ